MRSPQLPSTGHTPGPVFRGSGPVLSVIQVKPSSNQVNLASCCVMPPDLTAFAKEFDIQLLTHNDPKGEADVLDG